MKANGFFRKLNFLIALGGVFAALTFYGCGNLFSSADDAPANFSQPREGYGIVSGNLPSSDSASARTAMPSGGNTPSSYKVFAQNGSQRIEANVNNADRTFSIALPFGTWKITANGLLPNGRIIFTQTKEVTLDASASTIFLQFELGYSTNPDDGDGEISLSVSFPPKDETSLIRGIEYILSKGEEKIIQNVSDADLRAGRFEINHTTDNLGAWHLTIQFYGDFSNLVYRIDQTVNVYANLTTDTFKGSAPYISDGKIVLTGDLLADFQNTTLYVNATNGKDTNTGTQFDPLQTFNRALELVNNSTRDANTEFRIFLQTDVADGAMLELKSGKKLTVASVGADDTARTIKSLGRTFIVPDTSELTVQSVAFISLRFEVSGTFAMNGGSISGNTADTNGGGVYVDGGIFEMNGGEIHDNNAKNGGAIYVETTGKATISNTKIFENTADTNGGGVYVTGTLEMKNSEVSKNKALDTSLGSGGGVCVYNGTFIMDGGKISDNEAKGNSDIFSGGGIWVGGSSAFTMKGGTVSGNKAEYGGGIWINGSNTFAIANCTFSGNTANKNGGAVYIYYGTFEIKDGTFSENSASGAGGAVYVRNGTITMNGSTISKNTANNGGGVDIYGGTGTMADCTINGNTATSKGGGIYVYTTGTFTMKDGRVGENKAGSIGGGVFVYGGKFEMDGGTISKNDASGDGGGVYVTGNTSSFTMTGGTIGDENTAQNGGGVYVANSGMFTMSGGTIIGNKATKGAAQYTGQGGGVYVYSATLEMSGTAKITGNNAYTSGGGIYIYKNNVDATLTMLGGEISKNTASDDGSGVYNQNGVFTMSGTAKIADDNDVYLNNGVSITVAGALTAENPVAIITLADSAYEAETPVLSAGAGVSINNTICNQFAVTQKSDDAGTEWKIAPNGTGYGVLKTKIDIYVSENGNDDGNEVGDRMNPFATIQKAIDKVIKQNDGTDAYTIYVDGIVKQDESKNAFGMADFSALDKDLNLTIKALSAQATLDANNLSRVMYASPKSGALNLTLENLVIMNASAPNLSGGGIQFLSSNGILTMTGCEVRDNEANFGGGIYTSGALKMENCIISGNEAGYGAGVHISGSAVTMTNCTINGNIATTNGGGIYIEGGNATLTMTGGTIENNEAEKGGGIYVNYSTFTMNGTAKISGNTAHGDGGGVAISGGDDTFTMNGGTISGNTAVYGAGIHVSGGGTFAMEKGTISRNIADGENNSGGGGIHLYNGKVEMSGGEISGNEANGTTNDSGGGGIYIYHSNANKFTMTGGTISGNTAIKGGNGGGIYIGAGSIFTNIGGIVSGNTFDDVYPLP